MLQDNKLMEIEQEIRKSSIPYDYDTKEYPIEVIFSKYQPKEDQEQTLFIPTYQRDLVWDKKRKSRFIESLFLGVPIPPIFVALMDDTGKLELIDGSQRIRTIVEYVKNDLVLTSLVEIESLNNTKFMDLSPARRRKFESISLRFHVITDKADLAVRADIFDRLNSNGMELTPTQIRKGAFADNNYYKYILELSSIPEFTALVSTEKDDEELVLRFFAYSEKYLEFKHDVAIFLNRYVEQKEAEGFDRDQMYNDFIQMLAFVNDNFEYGFRKKDNAKAVPNVRFEAIAVGSHLALKENPNLRPQTTEWINSKEFRKETTSDASNNRKKLVSRIEFVRDCLLGIKNVNALTY